MSFELLLDAVLGERELFHVIDCTVCGSEEIYYVDPISKQQIGKACSQCGFVQKFEFDHQE
ncbi:acyltransferase [Alkalihalobacterium alkalinitrilicum]|uniref:acyltransferase n=1 Tax=Alkalihalobacterium alkalinitrilicum TaxID=427920 RepID=UPI0009949568|nr:acyltransferase [Alkalihalobacterium alkalinitrilicum]